VLLTGFYEEVNELSSSMNCGGNSLIMCAVVGISQEGLDSVKFRIFKQL
jgi:hypothetical protein